MKQPAKLFLIMGIMMITIGISVILSTPWEIVSKYQLTNALSLNFLLWFAIGITQIAVAYLIDHQIDHQN